LKEDLIKEHLGLNLSPTFPLSTLLLKCNGYYEKEGWSYSLLILVGMSCHGYLLEVRPVLPPVVHVEKVDGAWGPARALPLNEKCVFRLARHVQDPGWGGSADVRLHHYCIRGLPLVLPREGLYPKLVFREGFYGGESGCNSISHTISCLNPLPPRRLSGITEVDESKRHIRRWRLDGDDVREIVLHVENPVAL